MKDSLARAAEAKRLLKSQLARLRNRYMAAIYSSLAKGEGVRAAHRRLRDETLAQKKAGMAVSEGMLKSALASASSLIRRAGTKAGAMKAAEAKYGPELKGASQSELMAAFAFDLLASSKAERRLSKELNESADAEEGASKEKAIGGHLAENRRLDDPKVFYLASEHKDSAEDHAPYQGRMYVDAEWRSSVKDPALAESIEKYIAKNGVRTVQWVTGRPVWFVTRPNCRHYFKALTAGEAMGSPKTKLLKEHGMDSAIGDRQYLQTLRHSTSREWFGDVRNAQLLLAKYKERLGMHKSMYEEAKTPIIGKAIAKDRMLISKWEEYLRGKGA